MHCDLVVLEYLCAQLPCAPGGASPTALLFAVGLVPLLLLWTASSASSGAWRCGQSSHGEDRDQTQPEGELLHSERSYREIFNATGEALVVHDLKTGMLLDANDAALEFHNWSREEMVGMSLEEFITGEPPYGAAEARAHIARAARLGQLRFDWLFTNPQGQEAWCDVTLRRAEINGRACIVGAVRDTSDQRAAEEALRLSEQKLRSTLRAAPVGFGILRNRQFLWMNDEMSRMLGYPPEELIGRSIRLLYETEQEYQRVGGHVYTFMGQEGIGLTETRYVRKDGSPFDAHVQVSPMEPGNKDGRVAVAIIDITERKQMTADLQQANAQLQRKNLALEELMAEVRRERFQTADRIRAEIDRMLLPLAGRLEGRLDKPGREYLQALLDGVREAVSPLERDRNDSLSCLSPAEVRICTLVRRGLSAKEIARIESISPATVNTHRARIRQKLGITGQKVNLATHLERLLDPHHPV